MRTRILIALSLFSSFPAFAIETKPIDLGFLAPAGSIPPTVTLEDDEGATLSFRLPSGKEQREENLGQEFASFTMAGKPGAFVEAHDIDGDGVAEVIARTVVPGGDGALYVFRFDGEKGRFNTTQAEDGDEFLYVNPKSAVSVDKNGLVTVKAGKTSSSYEIRANRFAVRKN